MKYIIDTDKLPCNNGKNCTTCPFWSVDDTCEITEQVKKLPKYEERPHGEWEYLKEHITEMRDADGELNQKQTCQFILELMGVIEREGDRNEQTTD